MQRKSFEDGTQPPKRRKIQQSIGSMFLRSGPTYVEAPGIQQLCGYCNRKFRAPQGLAVHLRMHERARDYPMFNKNWRKKSSDIRSPSPPRPPDECVQDSIEKVVENDVQKTSPKAEIKIMTRNFTVAEKLRIIDKFKETKNISGTCRWVKAEFKRTTFARKTLSEMIAREAVYRAANGIKKVKKTVRARSGQFHRMDKKLAE